MEGQIVATVEGVTLARKGYYITGTLILASKHLVFSFLPPNGQTHTPREIWICYPIIERISKARGSSWISSNPINVAQRLNGNNGVGHPSAKSGPMSSNVTPFKDRDNTSDRSNNHIQDATATIKEFPTITAPRKESSTLTPNPPTRNPKLDHYSASHIRIQCKDFTFYSFDFINDNICNDVFHKLSYYITLPRAKNDISLFYAFSYEQNMLEKALEIKGWYLYNAIDEYRRMGFKDSKFWRITNLNENYSFCPSYPKYFIVPETISDNVLKHAGKFRSKQRIPAVVYRHRAGLNYNVIARCAQPLVGLTLQNRSLQDEKLIGEIFRGQELERKHELLLQANNYSNRDFNRDQPQRNLLLDLRPLPNAMAQHALGAGTENIDNYRSRVKENDQDKYLRQVDKIFCNLDNIHVMRDSLNKLTTILNELDRQHTQPGDEKSQASLQQSLTGTQWLYRLSLILQSVDRITKSVHLNNTNVLIHCSDGWDRTSQVSALSQLCLDPYYRTLKGFMVLIEKEWVSFGFKFGLRGDHGGCIGAKYSNSQHQHQQQQQSNSTNNDTGGTISTSNQPSTIAHDKSEELMAQQSSISLKEESSAAAQGGKAVLSFIQRAATHIKNTAVLASQQVTSHEEGDAGSSYSYSANNEKSPIFHQFLDCVYQLLRQHPNSFEFNSRFLKRLFYHHYSCQYGTFLSNSEREMYEVDKLPQHTVSVWDYFMSRTGEFINKHYDEEINSTENDGVLYFNYSDLKWWFELYGRSDEEMNGLSNSLDKKWAQMKLNKC